MIPPFEGVQGGATGDRAQDPELHARTAAEAFQQRVVGAERPFEGVE
jgi:hypothetical protein